MRILADENVARGVAESMHAAKDETLLQLGVAEGRVILTHDKDFAELAFQSPRIPDTAGLKLIHVPF